MLISHKYNTKQNSNVKAQCTNLPCLDSNSPVFPGKTETVTVSVTLYNNTFLKNNNKNNNKKSYSLSAFSCLYTKTNECVKSLTHSFFHPTKSRNHFFSSLFILTHSFCRLSDCCKEMDLLCGEDSSDVFSDESTADISSEEVDSWPEESIASCIEEERHFVPGLDYLSRFHSQSLDASAREDSVSWILKA